MEKTILYLSDFDFEEDEFCSCECSECGYYSNEEIEYCEHCGNDEIIINTIHEGMETVLGNTLQPWDNAYICTINNNIYYLDEYEYNKIKQYLEDNDKPYENHNYKIYLEEL